MLKIFTTTTQGRLIIRKTIIFYLVFSKENIYFAKKIGFFYSLRPQLCDFALKKPPLGVWG